MPLRRANLSPSPPLCSCQVIPYLLRRANENRSVMNGSKNDWLLIARELRRRVGMGAGRVWGERVQGQGRGAGAGPGPGPPP